MLQTGLNEGTGRFCGVRTFSNENKINKTGKQEIDLMIEQEINLYCGFCLHQDIYVKKKWVGNGKNNVSNAILCKKCGRQLNHKNTWK